MGASRYSVKTGAVALSASATKSLILLNPVTYPTDLYELGISFDGSAAATGVAVELYRVTTIGSPAGTTGTVVKVEPGSAPTTAATALTALSAEPTTVEVLQEWYVTPFGGLFVVQFPLGREPRGIATDKRLGIRAITPTGVTPNCRAYFVWEE
jgi:hypothetical protein